MKIQQTAEDYLETMLMLQEEKGYIRSIDIAVHLGVSKPSVSVAAKNLKENGYIEMSKYGQITLTESGMAIAQKVYHRHKTLTKFLIQLGVDPIVAEEDACKIEHDLSEESFHAICSHAEQNVAEETKE